MARTVTWKRWTDIDSRGWDDRGADAACIDPDRAWGIAAGVEAEDRRVQSALTAMANRQGIVSVSSVDCVISITRSGARRTQACYDRCRSVSRSLVAGRRSGGDGANCPGRRRSRPLQIKDGTIPEPV